MLISIVVPCFNEEESIRYFYDEIMLYLPKLKIDYEICFVDDGSSDGTIREFNKIKDIDSNVKMVSLSKNFGKEAAIFAGMNFVKGDFVGIMDVDLQDPPALLVDMFEILVSSDFDNVATYRVDRKGEPMIRSLFARAFYRLINGLVDIEIVDGARDYRLMKRVMVDAILSLREYHRFSKGIFAWVGFNTKYIEFENVNRVAGESKWSFCKLFKYAIEGIVAFSTLPLRFTTLLGVIVSLLGFVYMLFIIIKAVVFGDPVAGFPSLIVIISILGGIQLLFLGIIGEYLSKIYIESKKRPIYIVKDIL